MPSIFGPKSHALYAPPYGGALAQPLRRLSPTPYAAEGGSGPVAALMIPGSLTKESGQQRLAGYAAASFGNKVMILTLPAPSGRVDTGKSGKFFPTPRKYFRKIANYFLPVGRNFANVLDKSLILW
jgi:hypothetical protein